MADKMLSAEKVREWISETQGNAELFVTDGSADDRAFFSGYRRSLTRLRIAIDSGLLDADCPKCGDTGVLPIDMRKNESGEIEFSENCDCPAGTGRSET